MTPQPIVQKPPALLQGPDKDKNLANAEILIAESWELLAGVPMTPATVKAWAFRALEIAETWERFEKLVDLVAKGCNRRPVPFEMRRIYEENIGVPADGVHDWQADQNEFLGGFKPRKAED